MKNVSQNKFKKKSQIFKLKTILNDVPLQSELIIINSTINIHVLIIYFITIYT